MKDVVNKSEAWEIMQFLMNQVNNYSSGDELMNGLLDCMAEIFQYCETENKQQFLTVMIPKLIELTKTDVDYSLKQVVEAPEYQNENGVERLTMDTKNMGKVQMSINTTAIEVVSNAVRLIHNLIIDADDMMLPFISFCLCFFFSFLPSMGEVAWSLGCFLHPRWRHLHRHFAARRLLLARRSPQSLCSHPSQALLSAGERSAKQPDPRPAVFGVLQLRRADADRAVHGRRRGYRAKLRGRIASRHLLRRCCPKRSRLDVL